MKDVYWFSHDSNASRDIKMMQLKHLYDFWGIGVYWSVIEVLREQPNYRFSCSESGLGLLCTLVMCSDTVRFNNWFNDCIRLGLLKIEENEFFSTSLCERMQIWEIKKSNGSKGGRPPKTETITETKPKHKANQNHNRIEENRIEENNKKFLPPTLIEVQHYFSENGYTIQAAERAYNYYNEAGWKDSKGNKVKNWKQKMQGVWFKDENKQKSNIRPMVY